MSKSRVFPRLRILTKSRLSRKFRGVPKPSELRIGKSSTAVAVSAALVCTLSLVPVSASAAPTSRLAGIDRYETAVNVALAQFANPGAPAGKKPAQSVYLATGRELADALVASRLWDGPVLYADWGHAALLTQTISALAPHEVVALGGESAVPTDLLNQLASGRKTSRLGGFDRYETAALIAERLRGLSGAKTLPSILLARGDAYPDALAASLIPGSKTDPKPILLTTPSQVPAATVAKAVSLGATSITVLGGEGAVSSGSLTALADRSQTDQTNPSSPASPANDKDLAEARLYLDGWFYDKASTAVTAPYAPIPKNQRPVGIKPTDGVGGRAVAFMGWRAAQKVYDQKYSEASAGYFELLAQLKMPSGLRDSRALRDAAAKLTGKYLLSDLYSDSQASLPNICQAFPEVFTAAKNCDIYNPEYYSELEVDADLLVKRALERSLDAKNEVEKYEKRVKNLESGVGSGTGTGSNSDSGSKARIGVTRLGGANRYETAALIARSSLGTAPAVLLVAVRGDGNGADFADAVLAGGLRPANASGSALVLVPREGTLPAVSAQIMRDFKADSTQVMVLGGSGAVSDTVLAQL